MVVVAAQQACASCLTTDESKFYLPKAGKRSRYCKECNREQCRKWYAQNKERVRQRTNTPEHREKSRTTYYHLGNHWEKHIRRAFGWTAADYDSALSKQGGVCGICKGPPDKVHFCIDHCHKTGVIRGLLCSRCNRSMGAFSDSPEMIQTVKEYLERSLSDQDYAI